MSDLTSIAFQRRNIEQYRKSLAAYLPNDRLFAAKNIAVNSNLFNLLKGLAFTLFNTNGYLREWNDDISPLVTQKFLSEWESAVGIPDDSFSIEGLTPNERRIQIIAKLSYMAVQNNQDFIDLALWLGFVVTVTPGIDDVSGATAGLTDTQKRFTIVIESSLVEAAEFPMTFPFLFGGVGPTLIQSIFNKVKPSNCQVLYNFTG